MRRHFDLLRDDPGYRIRLVAEGHAVLLAGQERLMDRMDRLEVNLTSLITTSYSNLERRVLAVEDRVMRDDPE